MNKIICNLIDEIGKRKYEEFRQETCNNDQGTQAMSLSPITKNSKAELKRNESTSTPLKFPSPMKRSGNSSSKAMSNEEKDDLDDDMKAEKKVRKSIVNNVDINTIDRILSNLFDKIECDGFKLDTQKANLDELRYILDGLKPIPKNTNV